MNTRKVALVLASAMTAWSLAFTPAFAAVPSPASTAGVESPTSFLQRSEYISWEGGASARVYYTVNDSNNTISAINRYENIKLPSGAYNEYHNNIKMDGGKYFLLIIHYKIGSQNYSKTAKLWP